MSTNNRRTQSTLLAKTYGRLIFKHFLPISGKLWTKISDAVNLRQRYTIYTETTHAKMIGLLQPQGLGDIPRRK